MTEKFTKHLDDDRYRHVLGLSGGKDSAALAIYIMENYPEVHAKVEYFFTDTGAELTEAYEFLDKLEAYLGKEIVRLSNDREFEHWLKVNNGLLPSPQIRWCTKTMKIKPFEKFVGDDPVISYIGIRADEFRDGYISQKDTIKAVFPFIEDGLVRDDIFQLLEDTVGIPEYYEWRSRSGCYFCFFQRQDEWLGLKRRHPDLFNKAKEIEARMRKRYDWKDGEEAVGGVGYTWSSQGTLDEIIEKAERAEKRKEDKGIFATDNLAPQRWQDVMRLNEEDDDPEDQSCVICSL